MANSEASREHSMKESIKKKLEAGGELNKIRANLRLQVLNILRNSSSAPLTDFDANGWTHYDLINQLILEYLQWMSFNYSAEILDAEIGPKGEQFSRNEMEKKLAKMSTAGVNFVDNIPLLLTLLNEIVCFEA